MAHEGQELEGPGGIRLTLVTISDAVLEMEANYPGTGAMPPPHLHPRQDERFEVLDGSVRAIVGGEETMYAAGESFDVPANTVHQMGADEPTRLKWEVRPALRTADFFERLYTATPEEMAAPGAGEAFLEEFSEEFRLA